jgi:hypothetical protein
MHLLQAPWNDDQVASLNKYQQCDHWHPFTCSHHHTLVAVFHGWVCPNCEYTQNWCHDFMANWKWKDHADQMEKIKPPITY